MIDHISTYTLDYLKTRDFYAAVFKGLGYTLQTEFVTEDELDFPQRRCCGFGADGKIPFWIIESRQPSTPRHIAFAAEDRPAVDAFYQTAIDLGAECNGRPGLRPVYHEHYYGAFVIDPDGNDIEAVCHLP